MSHDVTIALLSVFGLAAGVILFAFLVNRYAPTKRKTIRRSVTMLIVFIITMAMSVLFTRLGLPGASHTVFTVAELVGLFTLINLAALAIFDLGLPSIGVEIPNLLGDIAIGVAYIVAVMIAMRHYGVDLTGMIAATTIVTSILALSLQATLGNILGGVALQVDDSIQVGDWVKVDGGNEGRVRAIRWRHTVMETRDWDTVIVPNAVLLGAKLTIMGKREGYSNRHRMWVHFNVDFRYAPSDVIRIVQDALRGGPMDNIAGDPMPDCVCMDFAKDGRDSFAYYAVRYWILDIWRNDATNSAVRARIYAALRRAEIPLALPAAQLFLEQDDEANRARKLQREHARRLAALTGLGFLQTLTEVERDELAGQLRYTPFVADELIARQGTVAHWLYILTRGTVEVRLDSDGGDRLVATIEAPDFFGEMGLMTGEPRAANVFALTDVECYRLDKKAFDHILLQRPEVAADISELLAERKVELDAAIEHLDVATRQTRLDLEKNRLLDTIQGFFGLGPMSKR